MGHQNGSQASNNFVLCREKKRTTRSVYQSSFCRQTSIQDALKRFTLPVVSPAAWIQFPQHPAEANCGNFNHLVKRCRSCCDRGGRSQHPNADCEGEKPRNPSSRPHRSPPGNSQTNPHLGANPELFFSKIKARLSGLLKCLVNKCGKCSTSFTHKNIEEPVVCVEGFGSDPPITYPHS